MGRRSSPDRIHAARRAAVLSRLTQERGLERMTAGFWDDGTSWLFEQLGDRK
jgi:hypothetical protein